MLFCFGDSRKSGGNSDFTFWSDDVEATAAAFEDPDGNRFGLSSK